MGEWRRSEVPVSRATLRIRVPQGPGKREGGHDGAALCTAGRPLCLREFTPEGRLRGMLSLVVLLLRNAGKDEAGRVGFRVVTRRAVPSSVVPRHADGDVTGRKLSSPRCETHRAYPLLLSVSTSTVSGPFTLRRKLNRIRRPLDPVGAFEDQAIAEGAAESLRRHDTHLVFGGVRDAQTLQLVDERVHDGCKVSVKCDSEGPTPDVRPSVRQPFELDANGGAASARPRPLLQEPFPVKPHSRSAKPVRSSTMGQWSLSFQAIPSLRRDRPTVPAAGTQTRRRSPVARQSEPSARGHRRHRQRICSPRAEGD